jgi:hypothetical protein
MNPFLIPPEPKGQKLELNPGSGRYYARFSQAETLSERRGELYPAVWLFEAFDAAWFDRNQRPALLDDVAEYYHNAKLFVLEITVKSPKARPVGGLAAVAASDADNAEPEDWFIIQAIPLDGRALNDGEVSVVIYPNLYLAGITASLVEAAPVDPETSDRLKRAVSTAHIPDATELEVKDALAILAGTSIDWVVTYDVGQGNSIGLCGSDGFVKAYFDLGGGVLANVRTFPTALTRFCFTQQPPIILSHWDFDHWSSANRDRQSHSMTWIAPRQSVGPTHVALMTMIVQAGRLLLVPPGSPPRRYGQVYLELCTGRSRNGSGFALTLSEQANGAGQQMLFPGDARYTFIPSFPNPPTNRYLSVVVPHHGGDMTSNIVPICPQGAASRLVYSHGRGNTFRHPRPVTRIDHAASGWRDPLITPGTPVHEIRETVNRGTSGLGHVLLGWQTHAITPPLPCGGGYCRLQAQQL